MTEEEMRESDVPWFKSEKELMEYIDSMVNREHDYGTSVYAMSMSAVAVMQYISSKLGMTGFQASCADLDVIRRTRIIEGPFMITKLRDALYPQYSPLTRGVGEFVEKNKGALDRAVSHIVENINGAGGLR